MFLLFMLGVASAVILALTLFLRRLAPRLGRWPAGLCMGMGLILFVWGALSSRSASSLNALGAGMAALGAMVIALLGALILVSAGIALLVAWMVSDRPPPSPPQEG